MCIYTYVHNKKGGQAMSEEKARLRITETDEGVRIDILGQSLKDLGACCAGAVSDCCSGDDAEKCCSEDAGKGK
jgi:hypothetical protein